MAPAKPVEASRKFFTVEEANRTLPLVKAIVGDIVRQAQTVNDLGQRLSAVLAQGRRRPAGDPYWEELAQSQAEMETEEAKLADYIEELTKLGVELKGYDGLCDFPSLRNDLEVYLCWRLGEPEVQYWHDLHSGFAGRQPLKPQPAPRPGPRSR